MAKRIITVDGIALSADKEEEYAIIPGSDGYDYIVEKDENGNKVWVLYNYCDDNHDKNTVIEHIDSEQMITQFYKPILDAETIPKSDKDKMDHEPKPSKKIIVKKTAEKISVEDSSDKDVKDIGQDIPPIDKKMKITLKPKKDQVPSQDKEPEKKLSKYHTFIKEFLAENSHIPWNERMKAANEAWKQQKLLAQD